MGLKNFPRNWCDIKQLLLTKKGNNFYSTVFKCFNASMIYNIWMERNPRAFRRLRNNEEQELNKLLRMETLLPTRGGKFQWRR